MTALQVNGSAQAATALAIAGRMFPVVGGTGGNITTKVGASTGRKPIYALGFAGTSLVGAGSIPAPTDSNFVGWIWDATTLEGQRIAAGTWTPTFHLLASVGTTVTATVQWFKRSSAGVYTQIGTDDANSIALTTSSQNLTFASPPSLALMDFATGDKLCMWLWVNQTAGGGTNSTITVVEAISGSTQGTTTQAQTATPGYAPTPVALACTIAGGGTLTPVGGSQYVATVLADSPLRYYRLGESATPAHDSGSQAQDGTFSGGVYGGPVGLLVGQPDSAMTFDGTTGYITTANTSSIGGLSALSVECWFSFRDFNDYYRLISSDNTMSSHVGFDALLDPPSQSVEIVIGNGTTAFYSQYTSALALGVVYHVVFTYDGANITTYLNGAQVGSPQAMTGTIGTPLFPITLAKLASTTYGYFSGMLSEAAIYGSALSSARVLAHYTAGTTAVALAAITALASTSDGVGALTPSLVASFTLTGTTIPGVGTLTGTITLPTALSVTIPGVGTTSGTLALATPLVATLAGTGVETVAAPTFATTLSSTASGVGVLTASLTASYSMTGATMAALGTCAVAAPTFATSLAGMITGQGPIAATITAATSLSPVTVAGSSTLTMAAPTFATQLSDTMAGHGICAPSLTASYTLTGATLSGVGTLTGASGVSTALTSTMTGVGTLAAPLSATLALTGATLAGVGTLSGVVGVSTHLAVTVSGIGSLTPTLTASLALVSGTLAGQATLTATLTASLPLSGASCAGVGTLTGVMNVSGQAALAGTMTGQGALSGTLAIVAVPLAGTLAGTGTLTGTVAMHTALAVTCAGVGTVAGTPTMASALATALVGTGQLTLTVGLTTPLAATMASVGTLAGTLQAQVTLFAAMPGAGTLAGTLSAAGAVALAATLVGTGTLGSTLTLGAALSTAMPGSGQLTGTLFASLALASECDGRGTLSGTLLQASALSATMAGTGTLVGVVAAQVALLLAMAGVARLSGTLSIPDTIYLSATCVTRDMQATALTRDMQAIAKTRS